MRRGGVWEEAGGDERREDGGMGMGDMLGWQGGMREGADGGMVKGRGMRICNGEEEERRREERRGGEEGLGSCGR